MARVVARRSVACNGSGGWHLGLWPRGAAVSGRARRGGNNGMTRESVVRRTEGQEMKTTAFSDTCTSDKKGINYFGAVILGGSAGGKPKGMSGAR